MFSGIYLISQAEPENESVKACQDVCEQAMCVSEFVN